MEDRSPYKHSRDKLRCFASAVKVLGSFSATSVHFFNLDRFGDPLLVERNGASRECENSALLFVFVFVFVILASIKNLQWYIF